MLRFAAVATLAIALAAAGCGGDGPTASPGTSGPGPAPGPVSVTDQHDGVVVTVAASAGRVEAGEGVQVRVGVLNAGLGTVSWQSGGCELLNGFAVEGPPIAQPPAGRDWPGALGLAKWSATAIGLQIEPIHPPNLPDGASFGCPADLRIGEIDPGETIVADAAWFARTSDGAPAPPGPYRIRYAFPYLGRMSGAQVGDPMATRPIEIVLPIEVGGAAFAGLPATLAIDAALADARVAAWAAEHLTQQTLGGAEIRLVDGRWRFVIRLSDGRATVAWVDPETGRVEDAQLAPSSGEPPADQLLPTVRLGVARSRPVRRRCAAP